MHLIGIHSVRGVALYADPGSGALLWQLVGSFFVGLLFYARRLASWVKPARQEPTRDTDAAD